MPFVLEYGLVPIRFTPKTFSIMYGWSIRRYIKNDSGVKILSSVVQQYPFVGSWDLSKLRYHCSCICILSLLLQLNLKDSVHTPEICIKSLFHLSPVKTHYEFNIYLFRNTHLTRKRNVYSMSYNVVCKYVY